MGKAIKVTAQFYTKWGSLMQPHTYNSIAELKRAASEMGMRYIILKKN
jgi:hypothetical protein